MPRRILLLITDLKIGGTPTVARELSARLNQIPDVYVEVACLAPWGPVADQISKAGIHVTALGARGPSDLAAIGRLVGLIRSGGFDTVFSFLIHANAAAAAASLVCRRVRFIQSIQTTQPHPRWHWMLQRLIHHAADKIVVPSASGAQVASAWADVPTDKIVVIPNAIDPEAFDDIRSAKMNRPASPLKHIGFIGRLDPVKRIPDLLEASAILGDGFHLDIFGEGAERHTIESRIASLNISNRVTLHGLVSRPQTALSQIDVLVLPSEAEGFGLVLIEAMAAGVPVVASSVAGIRDVVKSGVTGLLTPPANPRVLADTIRRISSDARLRSAIVQCAIEDVRQRFSWPPVIEQYRQLLAIPSK